MTLREPTDIWEQLFKPIELATWAAILVLLLLVWRLPLTADQHLQLAVLALAAVVSNLLLFRWLVPRYGSQPWVHYLGMTASILLVGCAYYLLHPHGVDMDMFFVVIVVVAGIVVGWRMALVAAFLCLGTDVLATILRSGVSLRLFLTEGLHLLVFLMAGYLASSLAGIIRRQADEAARRSRNLTLLLDTSITATSSLDLNATLPRLAEKIARGLPATFCRICLLDEGGQHLVTYSVYPLRPLEGWQPGLGQRCALENLPWHRRAIETGQAVIVRKDDPAFAMGEKERQALFFEGMKTACLVPLMAGGRALGVISVGEARSREREPFGEEKLGLLQTLAAQVAVVIHNTRLHQATQRQAERVAVLNEVARAISSTIEMGDLLELIYEQLSRVIPTDSYYVALYDPQEEALDVRLLIDEEQRFPPEKIPVGQGLSSLVIRERKPLLVRHLSQELDSLPVKPVVVGQDRVSESWLGVPMMVGDHFMGLLAMASYQPYAFDEEDVAWLANVAGQAALALDNARHHAEVEEQARRDSLTGVYNHNHFLSRLSDEVGQARDEGHPVSLIMLDIDYFKAYNDTYGHVIGDEVLRLTVQAIEAHVKKTDVVGRWGGEEFGIVLPGATTDQACGVAERVRQTLAELSLVNGAGQPIPKPTVSQGIATFPDHVADADQLVVTADRALYRAKSRGRDQVRVAEVERRRIES